MSKDVIIVGGGESVREGLEMDLWSKLEGKEIWSLNYAFMTMPYLPSRQLWIDISFFKNNIDALQKLAASKVPCYAKKHNRYLDIPEIKAIETSREPVDFNNPSKMFIGRMGLSGFFGLSMACMEKFDRIFLLGYDFGAPSLDKTNTHYYQDKLNVVSSGFGRPDLYVNPTDKKTKDEVKDFELFTHNSNRIYNVSLISNIPYFEKISYKQFFEMINELPKV